MVDVIAIPDRLKNTVCQTERQNVLDGLFAEIVVDAVHLRFLEYLLDFAIELACAGQVRPERFFNDDAHKGVLVGGFIQSHGAELVDDDWEQLRGRGEIEEPVALRAVFPIDFGESLG